MTPQEASVQATVTSLLEDVRDQVLSLVAAASASIAAIPHRGGIQISVTFLASLEGETLDLCVLIREADGTLVLDADVSEGGSGHILSELSAQDTSQVGKEMDGLKSYVKAQVQIIASALTNRESR